MKKFVRDTDKLALIILFIMMGMQLSITKVFAGIIPVFNYPYNAPIISVIYLLMICAIMLLVIAPRIKNNEGKILEAFKEEKVLIYILCLLLVAIIVCDIVTLVKGQLRFTNILTHNLDYFYAFLALPILILLKEKKIKLDNMVNIINVLTIISMAIRVFTVIYYAKTGIEIECITRESASEGWIRNGRLRVMAPCMIYVSSVLNSYLVFKVKDIKKIIFYGVAVMLDLMYANFIWQSRVSVLVILVAIGVNILFRDMSRRAKHVTWSIAVIGVIVFALMGGVTKILSSFSMSEDALYGGENRGHLYAYQYFGARYLKSPIFGEGYTENLAQLFSNGRYMWMTDAGFIYSLVPMGILIGIFFIVLLVRGLYLYFKNHKKGNAGLILAFVATYFVNEFAVDMFFTPVAFAVPFILAICEYQGGDWREDEE